MGSVGYYVGLWGYCGGVVGMLCWVREGFLRDFWGVVVGEVLNIFG